MPKNQIIQKNGHFYEVVGQQPILKRVGDSADQQYLMDSLAKVKASKSNRTGRGEIYKPIWNEDGSLKEKCAPYQKISKAGRCVVKREYETVKDPLTGKLRATKKMKPLSADVTKQRMAVEQDYLSRGLSRKQKLAKAMTAIRQAKNYLASDGYGHHINKSKNIAGDKDQAWDESRKRWIVQKEKKCPSNDIAKCPKGTYPPGYRLRNEGGRGSEEYY